MDHILPITEAAGRCGWKNKEEIPSAPNLQLPVNRANGALEDCNAEASCAFMRSTGIFSTTHDVTHTYASGPNTTAKQLAPGPHRDRWARASTWTWMTPG